MAPAPQKPNKTGQTSANPRSHITIVTNNASAAGTSKPETRHIPRNHQAIFEDSNSTLAFAQLGNVIPLLQLSAGTTTLHDQP
jgi:hypothetical protein